MIALGSLFFWRQRDQENSFGLHFFIFRGILELQDTTLKNCSHGQDWADKWARIERESIIQSDEKDLLHLQQVSVCRETRPTVDL